MKEIGNHAEHQITPEGLMNNSVAIKCIAELFPRSAETRLSRCRKDLAIIEEKRRKTLRGSLTHSIRILNHLKIQILHIGNDRLFVIRNQGMTQ